MLVTIDQLEVQLECHAVVHVRSDLWLWLNVNVAPSVKAWPQTFLSAPAVVTNHGAYHLSLVRTPTQIRHSQISSPHSNFHYTPTKQMGVRQFVKRSAGNMWLEVQLWLQAALRCTSSRAPLIWIITNTRNWHRHSRHSINIYYLQASWNKFWTRALIDALSTLERITEPVNSCASSSHK